VTELKRVGGATLPKLVNNCLRRVLSRELCKLVRYTDTSNKTSFGPLKLASAVRGKFILTNSVIYAMILIKLFLITEAVRLTWTTDLATDTVINDHIATFLRNNLDRKKQNNGNSKTNKEETHSSGGSGEIRKSSEVQQNTELHPRVENPPDDASE
jgi:hypothetical protein